jgi:hypothetical protein
MHISIYPFEYMDEWCIISSELDRIIALNYMPF